MCFRLRYLFISLFCALVAVDAHAQTAPATLSTWTSNGTGIPFNVQWTSPNQASVQQIACSPLSTSACVPLNKAACSLPPIEISITATPTSTLTSTSTTQGVYIWGIINSSCQNGYPLTDTSTTSTSTVNGQVLLGSLTNQSSTFMSSAGYALSFPGNPPYVGGLDPYGNAGNSVGTQYTHLDIMNQYNACDPNSPMNLSTFQICIGVDITGNGCVGNSVACGSSGTTTGTTTSSDPIGFAQVQIDTLPPDIPTISNPKPLNGRYSYSVDYDSAGLDTYLIKVLSSNDPTNVALAADYDASTPDTTGCAAWTQNFETELFTVQPQTGTLPRMVNGTNGTTYVFCAEAFDYLRNPSGLSAPASATPQFECDLFDCYPDFLQTGFCAASLDSSAYLAVFGAAAVRMLRKKKSRYRQMSTQREGSLSQG